uniref:fibrous sheath CABYR-binding protein n=1 Tax=Jaculus jaculus TaxID=51337 RepID=UPI00064D23A7|nr:fibrous sheath CABYR-binding protein [Jaculus jaculus]
MEENDEPEQPISLGRKEIRKRRRPSQPMVDKSQQTEATEKKKHMAIPQSSVPKATLSIGNIPGSKGNYSAKEYESLRVSSQLQQTWVKRKHDQKMSDKSLQTETPEEEQKEIMFIGKTVTPEEKAAAVGEASPEFPESVQEVEIPSDRHATHLIDRSQQTSCTGDWTMMNIFKEKVDKEQQTYFSDSDMVFVSRPTSSFTKSKEGVQKQKSSGNILVSEYPEIQPTTSSHKEIRQKSISTVALTQETKDDSPVLVGKDGSRQEGAMPLREEGFYSEEETVPTEKAFADTQPPTEEILAEAQPLPAEAEPSLAEVTALQEQLPTEETPTAETAPAAEEASVEIQSMKAQEPFSVEPPIEIHPPPLEEPLSEEPSDQPEPQVAEVAPSGELPAEIEVPLADKVPVELQPSAMEGVLEEAPAEIQPTTVEETTNELQPPPPQEAPEEAPAEVQFPIADENLAEQSASEETPIEETMTEFQSPPAGENPEGEPPVEGEPPPAEETPAGQPPAELEPLPAEETPAGEPPAEAEPPPAEETPAGQPPAEAESPPPEKAPEVEFLPIEKVIEETPGELGLAEKDPVGQNSAEVQSPTVEGGLIEENPAAVQFVPASGEEVSDEVQPPSAEVLMEESPTGKEPLKTEELRVQEMPPEVLSPLSEKRPADEALVSKEL